MTTTRSHREKLETRGQTVKASAGDTRAGTSSRIWAHSPSLLSLPSLPGQHPPYGSPGSTPTRGCTAAKPVKPKTAFQDYSPEPANPGTAACGSQLPTGRSIKLRGWQLSSGEGSRSDMLHVEALTGWDRGTVAGGGGCTTAARGTRQGGNRYICSARLRKAPNDTYSNTLTV